jgi:hypothetical protein
VCWVVYELSTDTSKKGFSQSPLTFRKPSPFSPDMSKVNRILIKVMQQIYLKGQGL